MKKVILGILIGALGVFAWHRLHQPSASGTAAESRFQCDGRVRCSQMTSCEEAEFFLDNCPGVKMDGDRDGVPCETEWCGNR
jgi:hypothetical protein